MTALVHVAGVDITINGRMRQRCGWCGAALLDYDLATLEVPVGQEGLPGTWPLGQLVSVDGNLSMLIDHEDGTPLPMDACGRLDPDVTR